MGKAEGRNKDWHGHVTAITVAPEYRRLGLADGMMKLLENVSEKMSVYIYVCNFFFPFFNISTWFISWNFIVMMDILSIYLSAYQTKLQ